MVGEIPGSSDRYLKMSAKIMVGLFFLWSKGTTFYTQKEYTILSQSLFSGTFDVSFRECIFSLGGIPSLGGGGILDFLSVFFLMSWEPKVPPPRPPPPRNKALIRPY